MPDVPSGGVALTTGWVEPAYLEPDASWCEPGGVPTSPLANGGAFGAKVNSPVSAAARELADTYGRAVRVLFSREDCVRFGPKRPPIAATAQFRDGVVVIDGMVVGDPEWMVGHSLARAVRVETEWRRAEVVGPPTAATLRAVGSLEQTVLVEGALRKAGVDPTDLLVDDRAASVALDSCSRSYGGASAGASVRTDETGSVEQVSVRVAAGDPLDEVVLRSYAVGAAHMALGWVLSEGLTVDPDTGEILSLTIRSFGVLRARDTPAIEVTIIDDPGPPLPRSSDAVMAAVAAATWNALAAQHGSYAKVFPIRT